MSDAVSLGPELVPVNWLEPPRWRMPFRAPFTDYFPNAAACIGHVTVELRNAEGQAVAAMVCIDAEGDMLELELVTA